MRTRLSLAFFSLAMAKVLARATLHTYTDNAAFLAATGAIGPLPNFGLVTSGSATLGSLTFAANNGTTTLYIGRVGIRWSPRLADV